jgi:hypothetical protein
MCALDVHEFMWLLATRAASIRSLSPFLRCARWRTGGQGITVVATSFAVAAAYAEVCVGNESTWAAARPRACATWSIG